MGRKIGQFKTKHEYVVYGRPFVHVGDALSVFLAQTETSSRKQKRQRPIVEGMMDAPYRNHVPDAVLARYLNDDNSQ